MQQDTRWEAVLDPGKATDYFEAREGVAPLAATADWNVHSAWWCSEIARAVYRRDDRAAMYARAGFEERRFFDVGSTQGSLVVTDRVAVLVFRGTADLRDWLTNLRVAPVAFVGGGRVHDGFDRALAKVWQAVCGELDRLTVPAFVCGHSLGGALATLAAARRSFVAAYTFGAPRVGDAEFWQAIDTPIHRVVNGRDLVPALPPSRLGYVHGGELHHLGGDGDVTEDGVAQAESSLGDRRWFDPHDSLIDHAPTNYSRRLRD